MFKKFLLIVLFLNVAFADNIDIKVNGMVCDFCASTMEKAFLKNPNVESVSINLKTKYVHLDLKSGKNLSDEAIQSIVTNQGFLVEDISR